MMKMQLRNLIKVCCTLILPLLLVNFSVAQTGNTCDVPIEVISIPYATTDNTSNYGDDYDSGDRPPLDPDAIGNGTGSGSYLTGDDVVYAYTPSEDETLDIDITGQVSWTGVYVFTGCPFDNTVGFHTSTSTSPLSIGGLQVSAGTTYYIVISTYASPQSTPYTLTISETVFDCPELNANIGASCDDGDDNTVQDTLNENCECVGIPLPENDVACAATTIECNEGITATLIGATASIVDDCSGTGSSDLWFTFVHDGTQILTISESSTFDAIIQLFVGDDCENLEEAGACQDFPESFEIRESGTYYLRVRPYSSASNEGTMVVDLDCVDYDCPELLANIGESCDDGDDNTVLETVTEICECVGIPLEEGECLWTVNVSFDGWGDATTWTLKDDEDNTLLSGGTYGSGGFDDTQSVIHSGPVTFWISDWGSYEDNQAAFTVSNGNGVLFTGEMGPTAQTFGNLSCDDSPLVACEGTPEGGNLAILPASGPAGSTLPVNLEAEGYTQGLGVTYAWEYSLDEVDWESLATSTPEGQELNFIGTPGDVLYVRLAVTCNYSASTAYSNTATFEFTAAEEYCEVSYTNSGSDRLSVINTVGAIQNIDYSATTRPDGGYEDMSHMVLTAEAGATFTLNTTYV